MTPSFGPSRCGVMWPRWLLPVFLMEQLTSWYHLEKLVCIFAEHNKPGTCDRHTLQKNLILCHVLVRPWRLLSIWWYGWPSGPCLSPWWGCARRRPLWWWWVLDSRKRTRYCHIPRNIASTVVNDVVSPLCSLDELHSYCPCFCLPSCENSIRKCRGRHVPFPLPLPEQTV